MRLADLKNYDPNLPPCASTIMARSRPSQAATAEPVLAATIDSYFDVNTIKVWVPPCEEGTERAIRLAAKNFGSTEQVFLGTLAYWDYAPTVTMLAPASGGDAYSGDVRLQADARDDVAVTKVEYWVATGAGPHYHPTTDRVYTDPIHQAFLNDSWIPADDAMWTAEWTLVATVNATQEAWPYTCDSWTPDDGSYTIVAVAYDGHTSNSTNTNGTQTQLTDTPVPITVADGAAVNPPVVTFSSPPDGADIYAGAGNVHLSASAVEPNSGQTVDDIQFWFINSTGSMEPLGATDQNTPGEGPAASLLWDGYINDPAAGTPAPAGPLYLVAEAFSSTGRVGYAGVVVNIVDDASADVTIASIDPATTDYAGAVGGSHITLTIYGSGFVDTTDQDVTVYFGGAEADEDSLNIVSSTELRITVPHIPGDVPEGPVTLLVEVRHTDGTLLGSAERDDLFTVYDSPPTISILSPGNLADVGDGVVIVASALDDKGVTQVLFEVNDAAGGSRVTLGTATGYPYSVAWDMSLVSPTTLAGYTFEHTIFATVSDGVNSPVEVSINVVPQLTGFDNPPVVTITTPTNGATVFGDALVITVTVADDKSDVITAQPLSVIDSGTGVEVTTLPLTTTLGDPVDVNGDGSSYVSTFTAQWNTTTVPDGSFYLIQATASDVGSNTGVGGVNVTVQNAVPVRRTGGGGGGCHHDAAGQDAGVALAWLLAMLVGAVPFLATRRIWRASRQRVR